MLKKEAGISSFVAGKAQAVNKYVRKKISDVGKYNKQNNVAKDPEHGKAISEAQLDNANDLAKLKRKDDAANTAMGRVKGAITGKNKDRYKRSIDSKNQQKKDLEGIQKDVDSANTSKNIAYGVGGASLLVAGGGAAYAHKKNENTKKVGKSIRKSISKFQQGQRAQGMNKTAEYIDKEAGNAFQKFLLKKWKGGDVDGATNAMKRVSEGNRKVGQKKLSTVDAERQSHGLAYMGEKGGKKLPNHAGTNGDGQVARKLMKSEAKAGASYIDKSGKKVNLTREGASNAEKIKPGFIKSQNTGLKKQFKAQKDIGAVAKLTKKQSLPPVANNIGGKPGHGPIAGSMPVKKVN